MAVSTAGMVARRRFGQALKAVRENARHPDGRQVKRIDAAKAIKRKTIDRVSRFERGAAWPELAELEALLKLYGADLEISTELRTMLKEGQAISKAWWQEYEDDFPESLVQFIAYEDAAQNITTCAVNILPALLQTESYARAVTTGVAGSVLPPDVIERSVAIRRKRRSIFDKPAPTSVEFIFSEACLTQEIGGRDVLIEQLDALLDDVKNHRVTLRVVPFSSPVTVAHAMHVLDFAGADAKTVTVQDSQTGMTFRSNQKETREARYYIEALRALALSPDESVACIKTIRKKKSSG
ncbi:DUF5753 domain-containing protein [Streptomyces sp. NPDC017260]|uniref:DUF5753 domain-containing protein n=1 Tax=unclassified Streptomyces TaxID=2593676 RepID=UPI0037AE07E3